MRESSCIGILSRQQRWCRQRVQGPVNANGGVIPQQAALVLRVVLVGGFVQKFSGSVAAMPAFVVPTFPPHTETLEYSDDYCHGKKPLAPRTMHTCSVHRRSSIRTNATLGFKACTSCSAEDIDRLLLLIQRHGLITLGVLCEGTLEFTSLRVKFNPWNIVDDIYFFTSRLQGFDRLIQPLRQICSASASQKSQKNIYADKATGQHAWKRMKNQHRQNSKSPQAVNI